MASRTVVSRRADDDLDDLLGGAPSPTKRGPKPAAANQTTDWTVTLNGVSVTWLMQAFRMDRQTVKKKLARLLPIGNGSGGQPLYDFVQAASYLVKPQVDVGAYIQSLRPQDLPPLLQKEYWDARLKRQRWEERAGDLWRTDEVRNTFSEVFKLIRTRMQLWVDDLDRAKSLSNEHRLVVTQLVDSLQDDLHRSLIELAEQRQTASMKAEIDDEDARLARRVADDDEDESPPRRRSRVLDDGL